MRPRLRPVPGASHPVTTVWCADCVAEGRRHQGKLGEVRRWASGLIRWGVEDRRGQAEDMGGRPQKLVAAEVLGHPAWPDYIPPDVLPALCERHGAGSVSTSEVVHRGRNIVLKLKATA